ncbi:mitochondrial biogenesis AIM24-domain-containing protein [Phycomyces nitens]|nr:mitochondrial biogenesis AIM24-domain-containing protein [Phycomyces nitens]
MHPRLPSFSSLSSRAVLKRVQVTAPRTYVGLAFNENSSQDLFGKPPTVDRSLKSFQYSSTTSSSAISSVGSETLAVDCTPTFEVVSSGVGSALLVKLPPDTEITAATGSAIGSSSKITSKLTLDGSALNAAGKAVIGSPVFHQKFYTRHSAGDILLAPQRMGEIAVIELKGTGKHILRRDAFLAKTEKVTLELGLEGVKGRDTGLVNKIVNTVSGPGTIAISHYGGLYRFSLGAGEEYLANPRNLIMWDRRTAPTKLHPANPIVPSPRSPLRKYTFVRNVVDSPSLQTKLQYISSVSKTLRNYILGAPDFVRLKGPGDFYLSSRVEPRFEKSRLMNALAGMNDSAVQLFEQSAVFPSPPEQTITFSQAKKSNVGYASQKSQQGEVSYYAEVGPKNKVIFIPGKQSETV